MNILLLYQSPWWNAASYYAYNLSKILHQNKHRVIFAGKSDLPAYMNIAELGIETHNIDLAVITPTKIFKNIKKIKKLIDTKKINVLMPISAPGHIASGLIKKIYNNKLPVIKLCLDNVPPAENIFNKYLHNKLTDFFIFPGNSTKTRYDNFFDIKKYKILHAPIDIKNFTGFSTDNNLKKKFGIPEDKIIVSFIGRFSPEKGIFFLLDIIEKTAAKSDNIFFLLSGSEEQIKFKEVEIQLNEKKLSNYVKILDKSDDVRKLLAVTDIGILSSRYSEYICRIAMEFMCFKIPVVAPELNVIPEVVSHNESGFIYSLNDSQTAAGYILKLAEDNNLIKMMGKNGYNRIMNSFSYDFFSKEIENILTDST